MTTAQCPVCGSESVDALLCHSDTSKLEHDLGQVHDLVNELDTALAKMARIGGGGKAGKGGTHERWPINLGAAAAAWDLEQALTKWAKAITPGGDWRAAHGTPRAESAASYLLLEINTIRRATHAAKLVHQITEAIRKARYTIDRPAERLYLGRCLVPGLNDEGREETCYADIYARPRASLVKCKVCGITHEVADRREELMDQARDQLFNVREAAQIIGSYGELQITESTIRNYVSTGQLGYHGKVEGASVIRLGDLMDVITNHAAKPRGRKLKRAV